MLIFIITCLLLAEHYIQALYREDFNFNKLMILGVWICLKTKLVTTGYTIW